MSLSLVLPYFRNRADALGYNLWRDPFDFNNIPDQIYDGAYFLRIVEGSGKKLNMNDQEIDVPVELRIFRKGFRDVTTAYDEAMLQAEAVIQSACNTTNRLTLGLKNVVFDRFRLEPVAEDNDNSIIITLEFTAFVILQI